MAIDSLISANVKNPDAMLFQPTGARGGAEIVCTDAEVAAASAGELLAPFSYATAGASRWVRVGGGVVRAKFYARYAVGATVTTDPVIRVYGAVPVTAAVADAALRGGAAPFTTSPPNDGTWKAIRLDATTFNAAGQTLDLVSSGATVNSDATYAYSDETEAYDLQDSWYVTVLVSTAANVNTGTVPIFIRMMA